MIKIIEILIDDILNNAEACSERINSACLRNPDLQVSGFCSTDSMVFITLEDNASCDDKKQYRFAVLSEIDRDLVVAELKSRYYAVFACLGSFISDKNIWGLFASSGKTPQS